ncbi:Uncharacterised protein [Vibrio cholerae]|nr:Uncharacterised protein [Vibrio cholerae]
MLGFVRGNISHAFFTFGSVNPFAFGVICSDMGSHSLM